MPKTEIHLEKAREAKKQKLERSSISMYQPSSAIDPDQPSLPVNEDLSSVTGSESLFDDKMKLYLQQHVDWTSSLSRDNLRPLAMTLHSLRCRIGYIALCYSKLLLN